MKGRRTEWRGEPLTHRSRRSRSPLMNSKWKNKLQKRPYKSYTQRSGSGERRQDHPLRRPDHGKELVQEHSLLPQHRSQPEPCPRRRSLSPHDDGFNFQQHSIFPEHPSANPSWRISQSIRNREFYSQINEALPSSSLDIGGKCTLPQKSTFTSEGPSQRLYSDQPVGSTLLNLERWRTGSGSIGMGIKGNEIHPYNDRHRGPYDGCIGLKIEDNEIHPYNGLHRDQNGDMDRRQVFSKDLPFPKMPPSQLRAFTNASSPSILKEEFKGLHHDQITDGLATGIHRYPNDPLERYSYRKVPQPDSLRHDLPDESQVYDYDELRKRGLDDHRHMVQEELYKSLPRPLRTNVTSSTVLDYNGDWMEKADSPNRNLIKRAFLDHHDSISQDYSHDYHVGAQRELLTNSDNLYDDLRIKSSRDYENMPFEEGFTPEKEYFSLSYRAEHRNRSSLLSDHGLNEQRLVVRTHNRSHIDDLSDCDIERMQRRNYSINRDIDEKNSGVVFVNDRRSSATYGSEEMWLTEGPGRLPLSKSLLPDHSRYRKFSRSISTSDTFMPSHGASSTHAENDHNINLKRRLKHVRSDFHSSSSLERRPDLLVSYKHRRRGMHDRLSAQGGGTHESGSHFGKNDPPEDSEEFKKQVHKAFLRHSKLLNESPHNRRIYRNQGNAYNVLCSVCGSSSKEFVDTNSLVLHTYHSLKAGLKTEHLGFHKALCVLLGWNWRVPPDNSWAYQSIPVAESKAMQEDLILWPPLVIIHNSLIRGNNITKDAKIVTVEGLEKILRDMGFGAGTRVCLGKPANQSIFTVKFLPTFSGLQEAQKLHDHFSSKKHGKQEFQQTISSGKKNRNGEQSQSEEVDEMLYGYMAIAEDLDKLSHENKKRSLVKSKKDIQAIADAPLNTD